MIRDALTELNEMQMEAVCAGTPNAGQNLMGTLSNRLQELNSSLGSISVKMNISIIIVTHTVINAPVIININQGL